MNYANQNKTIALRKELQKGEPIAKLSRNRHANNSRGPEVQKTTGYRRLSE